MLCSTFPLFIFVSLKLFTGVFDVQIKLLLYEQNVKIGDLNPFQGEKPFWFWVKLTPFGHFFKIGQESKIQVFKAIYSQMPESNPRQRPEIQSSLGTLNI